MLKYIDEKNSNLACDEDTGEVIEATTVIVPIGSKIQTPEQQKAAREWREQQEKRLIRRKLQDELGYFYFVMRQHRFGKISAESAARLIYLCTYLNYKNEFMLTERDKMKKIDLKNVLNLSVSTTFKFWKEVENVYIIDQGENSLKLCCSDIVRGKLVDKTNLYQKIYIESIRNIYRATPSTKHRYLGYIFKLLPYVNTEYNIICNNPEETNLKKVDPFTATEICRLLGYDEENVSRLIKIYKKLTFNYEGEEEYFLSLVYNQSGYKSLRAFVNPHIMYSGSDYKRVEVIGEISKK